MREVDKRLGALLQVLRGVFRIAERGRNEESNLCHGPLGPLAITMGHGPGPWPRAMAWEAWFPLLW